MRVSKTTFYLSFSKRPQRCHLAREDGHGDFWNLTPCSLGVQVCVQPVFVDTVWRKLFYYSWSPGRGGRVRGGDRLASAWHLNVRGMSSSWEGCGSVERRKQHMHRLTVGLHKNGCFESSYKDNKSLLLHVNFSLQQWRFSPVWFHVVWICRMVLIVTFAYNIIVLPCQSNQLGEEQLLIFFGYMQQILRHWNCVCLIRVCVFWEVPELLSCMWIIRQTPT